MANEPQSEILKDNIIPALVRYICKVKCLTEPEISFLQNSTCKSQDTEDFNGHLQSLISDLKEILIITTAPTSDKTNLTTIDERKDKLLEGKIKKLKREIKNEECDEMMDIKNIKEEAPIVDNIQIKADNKEIERRIESFILQKQEEVNEFNRREFSIRLVSTGDSCARTESLFIPRSGSRSHIKITKVVNVNGPQTQQPCTRVEQTDPQNIKQEESMTSIIENRLNEIESHTNVKPDNKDICARLKAVEERILFLESLSPEYFNKIPRRKFKRETSDYLSYNERNNSLDKHLNITQIDSKIQNLRETLLKKAL